jgi:hypothetical protein
VKLTVSDGAHSRQIIKKNFITVNVCSGEPELTNGLRLNVYPNPAKSMIRIKFAVPLPEGSIIYIFDLMGRKVMEKSFNRGNVKSEITVDVSSLQKGLYIVKLISGIVNASAKMVVE